MFKKNTKKLNKKFIQIYKILIIKLIKIKKFSKKYYIFV